MMKKECNQLIRQNHMHTEMNKNLVCRNEEIKYNNITNQNKKFNFDYITKEGIKKHNLN